MPQQPIDLLKAGYAQLNAQFLETRELPEAVDPEIEFDYTGAIPDGPAGRGREALIEAMGRWADTFDSWRVEPKEFIEAGPDQVIVVVRDGGRVKATDGEVFNEFTHLWTFRDERPVGFAAFAERAEALNAAGAG